MTLYLALLRGINVGGHNRLPMKDLTATMQEHGYAYVSSYLQTGNVLFESPETDKSTLARCLRAFIADHFEIVVPVVIRTAAQLDRVTTRYPFLNDEDDFKRLHLMFLDREPEDSSINALNPQHSPGDRFSVDGAEIYLHLPNGAARTKLTVDFFERNLEVVATGRNWNTVSKLRSLMDEHSRS